MSNFQAKLCNYLRLVRAHPSYGRTRYYPVCALSHLICALRGRKVFTEKDLAVLRLHGFEYDLLPSSGSPPPLSGDLTPNEGGSERFTSAGAKRGDEV